MSQPFTLNRFRAGKLRLRMDSGWTSLLQAIAFGVLVLAVIEWFCRTQGISPVVLPAPSTIWARLISQWPLLSLDVHQTIVFAALPGCLIGTLLGVLVAVACDHSIFLRRGLLPVGRFISSLPVVGIAPIFVMWFGFDWQSKMAVVVVMTFFPALVNALEGFKAADRITLELMRTYAATSPQVFFKVKAFYALPFFFSALKINWSLALIGAIVAEFFGTPTVGIGFRISVAIGQLDMALVWAEIVVTSVVAIAGYGLINSLDRCATFWHASTRAG